MASREEVAWHEAGHACAMKQAGALNGVVELDSHGGGVTYDRKGFFHDMFVGSLNTRADELTVAIAGSLAESWVSRASVEDLLAGQTGYGGEGDGDRVLAALNGDPLDYWVRKTNRLIRGEKREIEALAEALYEHGRLDGDDARAILSGRY